MTDEVVTVEVVTVEAPSDPQPVIVANSAATAVPVTS
jgi:hypothetical protein